MNEKDFVVIDEQINVLRLHVKTKKGEETGEVLEFNLKDIELLDKLDKMWNENQKNRRWISDQLVIIDKKQDFERKGYFMSNNERLKYDALKSFFKRQKEIYNIFLGENGVEKLLNGCPLQWDSMLEIEKIISEQIEPKLNINMTNIEKEIRTKYTFNKKDKGSVLKEDE